MTLNTSYNNVPTSESDWESWLTSISQALNNILKGKLNCTTTVTFTASADTTTLTDSRIGINSYIDLVATTASAASLEGEGWWISSQTKGSATITHPNSSIADRTYRVVILA